MIFFETGDITYEESQKQYCYSCGYQWLSRKGDTPKTCPRCKLSKCDISSVKKALCKKCGNEWQKMKENEPCPKCGHSLSDRNPLDMLHCNQCDHEWLKRSKDLPKKCPVCRTSKWNDERIPIHTCRKCGYMWRTRSENPNKCPKCQSKKWDVTAHKLQCRRCGHRWVTQEGRTSDEVRICPSCKSRKWNETPKLAICRSCGAYYIGRFNGPESRCPSCNSKRASFNNVCGFCGTAWASTEDWAVCPRCGKPRPNQKEEKTIEIWTDGNFSLRYVHTDEFGFIYLWEGKEPTAVTYFHYLLKKLSITAEQFIARLSDPKYEMDWKGLAQNMYEHRDDYLENVPYLIKRLNICRFDATILSIHFTGMGPEAIAVKFGLSIEEVRRSFDRIMAAYSDKGIVVNDSIFTEDPISLY